jgi:hypothetical protein
MINYSMAKNSKKYFTKHSYMYMYHSTTKIFSGTIVYQCGKDCHTLYYIITQWRNW